MKGSSLNIEKVLYDSAGDMDIDRQFKNDLKKRIMASAVLEKKPVIELVHRHKMPYLKVAGWVLFAALSGSTIWGAGSLYSHMVAVNTPVQNSAGTQKDNSKGVQDNIQNSNGGSVNPVDEGKDVASANTTVNSDVNKSAQVVTPAQSGKADTGTSVTANKGIIKPQSQTPSGTNSGSKAGISDTAPVKPADSTAGNANASNTDSTSAGTPAVTEPVNTITLNMEAGRYIIKDINVTSSDIVDTLPAELNSLTADEAAKLPPASSSQTVYESGDSVYMISHVNGNKILIDKGQTPVLYVPIGLVSYIKDAPADSNTGSKSSSEVWVFDSNSANKYNLLSSDDGEYSYLNTFWSSDGKALYVLQQNNATQKYEIVKLTIDIESN